MTGLRAVAKAALSVLDEIGQADMYPEQWQKVEALRAALAQPQTQTDLMECAANGSSSCSIKPCGPGGALQCEWCGAAPQAEPKPDGWAVGQSYYPEVTTHLGNLRFGQQAARYTAAQVRRAVVEERERWITVARPLCSALESGRTHRIEFMNVMDLLERSNSE